MPRSPGERRKEKGESDQGIREQGEETNGPCYFVKMSFWLLLLFGKNETVVVVHFG